ncbi:MAG: type VI secretion system tip protein TssI/VgrG [Massilia sp.]
MAEAGDSPVSAAGLKALFGSPTQDTRLLRLTTPFGATQLLAECVRAEEGLSQDFSLHIAALSTDARIELKTLIGQPVLLELHTTAGSRPFHGHVTRIVNSGANGGLARYHLVVEPWTAFLAKTQDSRVFQDMDVIDILDCVFARWQGQGRLAPEWRFDTLGRSQFPRRSLCTQYLESDLAFAQRLMLEEGLFYFFEHTADRGSASLGSHRLVIADHNGVFKHNQQVAMRFTQPGAVMKEDSIDIWRSESRLQTNGVELGSWDYRTRGNRPVSMASAERGAIELTARDVCGAYGYQTPQQGERQATHRLQALEASREVHTCAGTVRTMAAGTRFKLLDHHDVKLDSSGFLIVRVTHLMHNNLRAELRAHIGKAIGPSVLSGLIDQEQTQAQPILHGERPLYRNRVEAIDSAVPYRTSDVGPDGRQRFPKARVHGQQTALVVGPEGAAVHTDRDHRIKVQFHWQRGEKSQSRRLHPAPGGHIGAPADETSGTWVRVASTLAPIAGANWGGNALPRVGQEVLVDFLDGDIDRPVVIGALYNGKGARDAQHNQFAVGAGNATGNAPAWFPGESGAHAHPAALSGIKSQAMGASKQGAGAYSQLVFDDSPGHGRAALQQHASAHRGSSELNLGALRHQSDNRRLDAVGFGAELKTEFGAALRAGKGMLLSTDMRDGAAGGQLDAQEATGQIEQSHQMMLQLATTAQTHNARLPKEAEAKALPAIAAHAHGVEVLRAATTDEGVNGGGQGKATAYSEPRLQLSAQSGIAATSAVDVLICAGKTSSLSAGQDINLANQGGSFHAVRAGISLFTYGKASDQQRTGQETGISLHAASGKVSCQSQSDQTRITADKAITFASVTKTVGVSAKAHVLMTAQGAFIKLEGGDIMIHAPGQVEFKATAKELAGPKVSHFDMPLFPKHEGDAGDQHFILRTHEGAPVKRRRYRALTGNQSIEGFTDENGCTKRLDGYIGQPARFELMNESHDEHFVVRDPMGTPMANMRYKILAADGTEMEGTTDESGRTDLFTSERIESVKLIYVPEDFPADQGAN